MWSDGLKAKEKNFLITYCTDPATFWNGTKTAQKLFDQDENTASVTASRIMKRPEVKKALHELIASIQPETDTENIFRLLHDLFLQASYNPADIVDENGQLIKPLAGLGELSKCIAQIIPIGEDAQRKRC